MSSERAPGGVVVSRTPEALVVKIHPFLSESGRNDVKLLRAGRYVLVGAGGVGLLVGDLVARLVALAVIVGGLAWIVWETVRSNRREAAELALTLGPADARVLVTTGGRTLRDERVPLRAVGRTSVTEAGYERWHVVANVVGREPLVVEMERHTREGAEWVANELSEAGRRARDEG